MSAIKRLILFMISHRQVCFDVIRIYLGIGLFMQGAYFLSHMHLFDAYLNTWNSQFLILCVAHYVAFAHICGGILLILGLLTRIAALVQFPILIGAIVIVHLPLGLLSEGFQLTALISVLLALLIIHGSGEWSVDYYLNLPDKKEE